MRGGYVTPSTPQAPQEGPQEGTERPGAPLLYREAREPSGNPPDGTAPQGGATPGEPLTASMGRDQQARRSGPMGGHRRAGSGGWYVYPAAAGAAHRGPQEGTERPAGAGHDMTPPDGDGISSSNAGALEVTTASSGGSIGQQAHNDKRPGACRR